MNTSFSESYKSAGVDVTAGYDSVERIMPHVKSTYIPGVIGGLGGFGGLFAPDFSGMEKPVLVSGTDGVGTKIRIAQLAGKHDTIGIDCVAMCVNDIICSGAEPMFFLDYMAVGKNIPERVEQIVSGVAEGCRQAECALVGGETAEHPGVMDTDDYDLAGFSVGIVDEPRIIDGTKRIKADDIIIGIASSGVHSNGFSLIRKVLDVENTDLNAHVESLGCTLAEELLKPTKIYVKAIKALLNNGIDIKGISHITGGGLYENVPRMLPDGITASIEKAAIPTPAIFELIAQKGNIPERDMYNTFNMGVGMIMAVSAADMERVLKILTQTGYNAFKIGTTIESGEGVRLW